MYCGPLNVNGLCKCSKHSGLADSEKLESEENSCDGCILSGKEMW